MPKIHPSHGCSPLHLKKASLSVVLTDSPPFESIEPIDSGNNPVKPDTTTPRGASSGNQPNSIQANSGHFTRSSKEVVRIHETAFKKALEELG